MEDFDCWDDDPYGIDAAYSDGKFAMIITAIVLAVFFVLVFASGHSDANVDQTENLKTEDLAIVYDSPSKILVEHEEPCPECGNMSMAVNNEVICRNKNCPNYGLAVPIDS